MQIKEYNFTTKTWTDTASVNTSELIEKLKDTNLEETELENIIDENSATFFNEHLGYIFLSTNIATIENNKINISPIHFFLSNKKLIFIHSCKINHFDKLLDYYSLNKLPTNSKLAQARSIKKIIEIIYNQNFSTYKKTIKENPKINQSLFTLSSTIRQNLDLCSFINESKIIETNKLQQSFKYLAAKYQSINTRILDLIKENKQDHAFQQTLLCQRQYNAVTFLATIVLIFLPAIYMILIFNYLNTNFFLTIIFLFIQIIVELFIIKYVKYKKWL